MVDLVWGKDKPERPCEPVKVYPCKYAGANPFSKYCRMQDALGDNVDLLLVTALD